MKHSLLLALILFGYLGLYNGHLAIYEGNSKMPVLVLPYRQERYSDQDLEKLLDGIPFQTDQELTDLLQDYTS